MNKEMYCTFEELIHLYTSSPVYVSVRELVEAGLEKEFSDRVEKIAPTANGFKNHWTMFNSYRATGYYFGLARCQRSNGTLDFFCTVIEQAPRNMIAHLIDEDVPPIDMEGLLTE